MLSNIEKLPLPWDLGHFFGGKHVYRLQSTLNGTRPSSSSDAEPAPILGSMLAFWNPTGLGDFLRQFNGPLDPQALVDKLAFRL